MKLILQFDMDNAAFEDDWHLETAGILLKQSRLFRESVVSLGEHPVRDSNGNVVGSLRIEE